MRKLILLIVISSSILAITGCEKNNEIIQISFLENSWTQSYEEKTSEKIEIYRPSDYKNFSLSRYRQSINFHDNDVCEYLVLAANDGHYMESGNWEYSEKTNIIKIFNSNSEILYEFEVVELTNDLLKLKARN
jgi:hypothetical protein